MANPVKAIGKGVAVVGLFSLFAMSVVGAFSLDLLWLYLISKASHSRNHNNFIVIPYFWNTCSFGKNYQDILSMMVLSPILTGITVALSIFLGVPEFGLALVAGWAIAAGILIAGGAIYSLGEILGEVCSGIGDFFSRPSTTNNSYANSASANAGCGPTQSSSYVQMHFNNQAPPAYTQTEAYNDQWQQQSTASQKMFNTASSPDDTTTHSAPPDYNTAVSMNK